MALVKSKTYKKKREKTEPFETENLPALPESTAVVPAADRDLLQLYLKEVGRNPLLGAEEEKSLALKVFEEKDKAALQKLVQSNLRFVVKIAFEYSRYGARILDLIQEGNVGLLKAVTDFNPYKDVRLTTYAVWWIRSYIHDYLMRNWSLVRIGTTAAQKKLFYRLKKEQEKYERDGMRPEPKAIAMNLGVDEADVESMSQRLAAKDLSLSSPLGNDDSQTAHTVQNRFVDDSPLPSAQMESSEQSDLFKKALEEFIDELDEREKKIFKDRLMSESPKTLIEIGDEYGFTKERARQLEERIKKKLKEFLAKYYPDISIN